MSGVYYHGVSAWTALPMHLVNPYWKSGLRDLLSLGRGDAIAVIPGPHAAVQITVTRPTLYLRGHESKRDLRPVDLTQTTPGVLAPGYRGLRVEFDFAVQ